MRNPAGAPEELPPRRVLIVDPDASVRREVAHACEQDGHEVAEADTGQAAIEAVEHSHPTIIVLELALPDMSGFDCTREIRRLDANVPIVVISARSDEIDVVVALEIGADDYMVKPLRLRELMARLAAHMRKARGEALPGDKGQLEFKDLLVDVNERRVFKTGSEVELTHTEFDLLAFLATNAGKVLSREKILNTIWGYEYPIETRVIDVHIRNLRRKIETVPSRPFYILAVPGIGYRFTNARP